jgi:multidrug efflux pump subunit AcrB
MIESSIRQGTLLAVGTLIFCVLSVTAALRMPVQMIPDLEVRTISVDTVWAGATPQDVEKEILIEQEQYLRTIPNLSRMVSYAETGRATIELEFPFGVDINEALIRVSNALSQVPVYPENVDEPRLSTSSFSENSFMFFRLVARDDVSVGLDLNLMRDFAEDQVRPRLERVPGVSIVQVGGGAPRQVRVEVDPSRLAQRGLTLTDLRTAIRARNRDTSAGDLDIGKHRYLVRTLGRFETVEDLRQLVLARRGDSVVHLADVANVQLQLAEIRSLSFNAGQPTLSLSVRREPGSNVIAIKEAMLPVVENLNRGLLAENGLQLLLITDDVRYVQDSLRNVLQNLLLGALLATAIMYLFLRSLRSTLVGVLGIPICTLAAFLGLLLAGRTVNVISLAGIAFAIGMTLDNTIVVLENIEHHRARGSARLAAAIEGVREVWPAVLASTLTTVLVFAPILFVEQEAGQLYSDVAIAISSSILTSMLVAVTLVPATVGRLGFGREALTHSIAQQSWRERTLRGLDALLATSGRRVATVAVALLLTLGAAWLLMPPAEYLPEGEEPKVFASMIAPPGYNLTEMATIAEELNRELAPLVEADPEAFAHGMSRYPALATLTLNVSPGRLRIISEPRRPGDVDALMESLRTRFLEYPGMRAFASRGSIISSNDGGTRSVNLDISGPDLSSLYSAADATYRMAESLFESPQIGSDPGSLSLDQPLVQIRPDWLRLAELGMTPVEFGFAVAALSDGAFVDEYFLGDDKVDIYLYSEAGNHQQLADLAGLPIFTPAGGVIPLGSVAEIRITADTDVVRRVDGRRTVTLNVVPPRSLALETAVERAEQQLIPALRAEGAIPSDVSIDISGAADQLEATRSSLGGNFAVAVLLSYLVLVAVFRHWGYPLLILATVPLGLAGGLLGLVALNLLPGVRQAFDMITMLGFLILLGTVVNNPILIVDRTRQNLRNEDTDVISAVREAVASRLRPILMTTLTTMFGLAPLVLIPGAGTELYRGLGVVVVAGLFCSTVVTLTFLPCLLVELLERTRGVRRLAARLAATPGSGTK